eukprot:GHVS01049309.1.p1 GENE.GHVS01049309.1~~GHVS01049309.1.p1  ORF type:complete len:677 (-),score=67.69 GHVS01049309.1:83-2113(-)
MMVGESSSLSRLGFCWRLTLCCLLMLVVLVKGNNVDVSDSLENAEPVDMTHQQFVKQKPSPPYYVRITELKELPKEVEQKELPKEGHETPATVVTSVEGSEGVALFFFHGLQSELPKWQGQIELYLNNLVSNVPVYLWVPDYHETIRNGFIEAGEKVAESFVKGIKHLQDLQSKFDCLFFCHSVGCLTLFHLLLHRAKSNGNNAGGVEKTEQTAWPVNQLCSKPDLLALREVSMKGCPFLGFKTDSPFLKWDIPAGSPATITPYGGIIDDLRNANEKIARLWIRLNNSLNRDCSIFSETKGLLKGGLHLFGAAYDEVFGENSALAAPWGFTEQYVRDSRHGEGRSIRKAVAKSENDSGELTNNAVKKTVIFGSLLYKALEQLGSRLHRYNVSFYQNTFHDRIPAMNHFPSVPKDSALTQSFLSDWAKAVFTDWRERDGDTSDLTSERATELAIDVARTVFINPNTHVVEKLNFAPIKQMVVDMFEVIRFSVVENSKMFPHNFLISNGIGTALTGPPPGRGDLPHDELQKLMQNERDEVYEQMCKLELAGLYRAGPQVSDIISSVSNEYHNAELLNQGGLFRENWEKLKEAEKTCKPPQIPKEVADMVLIAGKDYDKRALSLFEKLSAVDTTAAALRDYSVRKPKGEIPKKVADEVRGENYQEKVSEGVYSSKLGGY